MKKWLIKESILFYVGFVTYIAIECCFRGYSYPLMGIVGGISLILLDKINDGISWDIPLILQIILGGLIVTGLELLSGEFALNILHIRMWDYSGQWMAMCDDLICPLFSLLWVLLSGIGIILADAINYYILHDEQRPYYLKLSGKILFMRPTRECDNNG